MAIGLALFAPLAVFAGGSRTDCDAGAGQCSGAATAAPTGAEHLSLEGDADAISAGRRIYSVHCWSCHGANGEGGIGAKLRDNAQIHGDSYEDLVNTITNGVPGKPMRAWGGVLSPRSIREVAAFVQSLKGTRPEEKPGKPLTLM